MAGKHKTKFKEGDRINDHFILIRNFIRKTEQGKNLWRWECKCDCGTIFECREDRIESRYGCHSCTNQKSSTETALKKKNGIEHVGLKNRLLKEYRTGATKRNLEFNLTFDQFINLMEQDCVYCGAKPKVYPYQIQYMQLYLGHWAHNGIDRVDSSKGYTLENCVPCCKECNYAKHEMSVDEYKQFIIRSYNHLILKGSTTILKGSTSKANVDGNGMPQ